MTFGSRRECLPWRVHLPDNCDLYRVGASQCAFQTFWVHLCFTYPMSDDLAAVEAALGQAVNAVTAAGLTPLLHGLIAEVWQKNLERYEPDELGDDSQTLGGTSSRNIANRVERLVLASSGHEAAPWDVPGLTAARPHGALRLDYTGWHFHLMKSPMAQGRSPKWETYPQWSTSSEVRAEAAEANSIAMGGYRTAALGQDPFPSLPLIDGPLQVPHYVFVWAAEIRSPATSGWLGVPVLGERAFAAIHPLWKDPEDGTPTATRPSSPTGPSFDERATEVPALTLKPRTGETREA